MKRLTLVILLLGLVFFVYIPNAFATGLYFSQIPEGLEKDCGLCHSQVPGLNQFGQDFVAKNYDFTAMLGAAKKEPQAKEPQTKEPQAKEPGVVVGGTKPQGKQDAQIDLARNLVDIATAPPNIRAEEEREHSNTLSDIHSD